ncbi:MAG: hypothetical protein ACR5K9_10705, partial [Wolbachia sp.]
LFHPIILILMPFKPRLFYLLQYWLFLYCCPSVCCVMGFGISLLAPLFSLLSEIALNNMEEHVVSNCYY